MAKPPSSILAHLLKVEKITAFLGGISSNFGPYQRRQDYMVVEADEFDRSFLTLHPDLLCITSMDVDHLDIYQNVRISKRVFNPLPICFNQTIVWFEKA